MLYLFDGYNILHAGDFADRRELVDALASFVAVRGARGTDEQTMKRIAEVLDKSRKEVYSVLAES